MYQFTSYRGYNAVDVVAYSTDEQVVGTYVDNRPIYQKSFHLSTLAAGQNNIMAHGIANFDKHIEPIWGDATQSDGRTRTIPNPATYSGTTSEVVSVYMTDSTNIVGWVGSAYTGDNAIVGGLVTMRYVKTS